MNQEQQMVAAFHDAFGIQTEAEPTMPDAGTRELRVRLIQEEFDELKEAFEAGDLVEVADALGDLLYVVYGGALACGIDLEPVFKEIHRSNMSKVGGHKRDDGKWVKPATYSPANLGTVLDAQRGVTIKDCHFLPPIVGQTCIDLSLKE